MRTSVLKIVKSTVKLHSILHRT